MRIFAVEIAVVVGTIASGCGDNVGIGTALVFDLDADLSDQKAFYDVPFPSDLRLHADGTPDMSGYPNPRGIPVVEQVLTIASDRPGFPTMSVAYFRFTDPLAPLALTDPIPASTESPILLADVDPDSPERGRLIPTVALTLARDVWATPPILAVSPVPGFILHGDRTYAYVVTTAVRDERGEPVAASPVLRQLARGNSPGGALGNAAVDVYAPLWPVLDELGIDATEVAAATVFTTGDVVADLSRISDGLIERDSVTIENLAVDPDDGAGHPRFCELLATVANPQYQQGDPPFNTGGLFQPGSDGLPIEQRKETASIVITLPNREMPATGFPLMLYFHGSGGIPAQLADRGTTTNLTGEPKPGEGPGFVVAEHGIAGVASAMPVSPDRLTDASAYEYLNFNNLAAFRDTFRQGVIEQRLLLDAVAALRIDPATVSACAGLALPAGQSEFFFDMDGVVASGQSMGGMYTNLVAAVEPRIKAAVPTGAGGFWSMMILETQLIPGVKELVAAVFGTLPDDLSFLHPSLHLLAFSWEGAEPFVYMPRLARRPLPGHPVRPIYQPVGRDDAYFPTPVYDAAAVAYGHQQAGDMVWPEMQDALELLGLGGVSDYPITDNLTSQSGGAYTGAVVQYAPDGLLDGHYIFAQRDEVKYQYGCFFASFLATGTATIPAPAALGTACCP